MHWTLDKLLVTSIIILSLCTFHSCGSDDEANCTFDANLISPESDKSFASGDDIPLNVQFTACTPIQSYFVRVRNRTTNQLVFVQSEFSNSDFINLEISTNLEVSEITPMDIEIRAEDANGNQIEETIGSFELTPPGGNVISLRFNLMYEGETLLLNREYDYLTGQRFEFSRFDMYMTDLTVSGTDGSQYLIRNLDYLKMTDTYANAASASEGYIYKVAGLDAGSFSGITFNIGLPPELNATTPSMYPVSHPLGAAGDYWDGEGWNSYIFASIEGRINIDDTNPDLEKGIALHLGSDNAFQSVEIDSPFSFGAAEGEEQIIDLNIDLMDLFIAENGELYDLVAVPSTHSLVQIPQVIELSNNLKNSINK